MYVHGLDGLIYQITIVVVIIIIITTIIMEDKSINKGYFSWLKNWKSCPTSVVVEFSNLSYQTLTTLCYKQGRCDKHDNAFKCFVFPLLKELGLIDTDTAWYTIDKVKPYYENESAKFWWNIPEYTGREDPKDKDSRALRPDGKLEITNENEHKLYLLECRYSE